MCFIRSVSTRGANQKKLKVKVRGGEVEPRGFSPSLPLRRVRRGAGDGEVFVFHTGGEEEESRQAAYVHYERVTFDHLKFNTSHTRENTG